MTLAFALQGALLLGAAGSPAPAPADTVVQLSGVEVTDERAREDPALRRSPGFARTYDVTASYGRLAMTSDLLAGGVGVHVRQFGGLGSFSAVSIRGSASSQVAFYLDGIPLNQAQYGVVNASDLPIEALERIEVYRGAAPLGFDSPGGGVVEMVTRQDQGTWARADAVGGSFGTGKMDAAGGFAAGRTSALLVAQSLTSDGDFRYLDDNDTPDNLGDDTWTTRANNAFTSRALTARLSQGVGPWNFALLHDRLSKDQGSPGTGANTALYASFATDRDVTGFTAGALTLPMSPGVTAFYAHQRDRFKDPDRELTGSRQDNDDRTERYGARVTGGMALSARNALSLAAEARRERYTPKQNLPTPRVLATSERDFVAFGIEDQWTGFAGRALLTGQVRQEATFDDFPAGPAYPGALPSPALDRTTRHTRWTAATRIELVRGAGGSSLALKSSVSRLARMPTLEELFGNRGGVHGNRDALPERVFTRDAGFVGQWNRAPGPRASWAPRSVEGQIAAFRSDAEDLLVFIQNTTSSSVAQNISAARLEGIELAAHAIWAAGVTADVSWTRQWTEDVGDVSYWHGKELPGHPDHEATLRVTGQRGPAGAYGELHAIGAFALDRYNQTIAPARALLDLGASFAFARAGAGITAACHNVGDTQAQDFGGYPLPGRSWSLGIQFHLDRKDVAP